jgi:tRNA modification GTPase
MDKDKGEDDKPVLTSAVSGQGLEDLWTRILGVVETQKIAEATSLGILLNSRHQNKLMRCFEELTELGQVLAQKQPGDEVVASILGLVLAELGEISGRVFNESLLESIFSRFCVGK